MNNLTEQEKKFADAFVYLFFHAPALMPGMKEDAAVYAGYDVPVDRNAADNFARALSEKRYMGHFYPIPLYFIIDGL